MGRSRISALREMRNERYVPHEERHYATEYRSAALDLPRCDFSGKLMFPDEQAARDELLECQIRRVVYGEEWRNERRAYPCNHCQCWHLTTQDLHHPQLAHSA